GAFFGESMFSRRRDASKVALVHLVERLRAGGFVLLDTQFSTPHLARFGVVEIPRADYEAALQNALALEADWYAAAAGAGRAGGGRPRRAISRPRAVGGGGGTGREGTPPKL